MLDLIQARDFYGLTKRYGKKSSDLISNLRTHQQQAIYRSVVK